MRDQKRVGLDAYQPNRDSRKREKNRRSPVGHVRCDERLRRGRLYQFPARLRWRRAELATGGPRRRVDKWAFVGQKFAIADSAPDLPSWR
jgi:hypothetical protein